MRLLFLFLFASVITIAQTQDEQALFGNKIWKEVKNSRGVIEYFDIDDNYLGAKKVGTNTIVYSNSKRRNAVSN